MTLTFMSQTSELSWRPAEVGRLETKKTRGDQGESWRKRERLTHGKGLHGIQCHIHSDAIKIFDTFFMCQAASS